MDMQRWKCSHIRTTISTRERSPICAHSRFGHGWLLTPGRRTVLMLLVIGSVASLAWRRVLAYLRYFQQEGYEALRFVRWTGVRPLTDPAVWLAIASWVVGSAAAVVLFAAGAVVLG